MDDKESAKRFGGLCGGDAHDESRNGIADILGGNVVKRSRRPRNTEVGRRPDPKNGLAGRESEAPSVYEVLMRRTYDMNKELAEDLRRGVTIKMGRDTVGIAGDLLIGSNKKRSR